MRAPCIAAALGAAALLAAAPSAEAARAWRAPTVLSAPGESAWAGKPLRAAAFDGLGNATAAWLDQDAWTVAARTAPKLGTPGPRQVLGGSYNPPTAASTGPAGGAVVAWVGTKQPGVPGGQVLVAESGVLGSLGAPEVVAQADGFYNQPGAAVAANARGDVVVLYADGRRLLRVRRDPGGQWGAPAVVQQARDQATWRIDAAMSLAGEVVYTAYGWDHAAVVHETPDGTISPARTLEAPGTEAGVPSLAMDDLGNAIVTWPELHDGQFAGPLRAAVKAPGLQFGGARTLDGQAGDHEGAPVALSATGRATIVFDDLRPTGPTTGSGGGIRVIDGLVPAGTFSPSQPVTRDLADGPVTVAGDPLGNAAIFFEDWDTFEPRVVRRTVLGRLGQERNVTSCPNPGVFAIGSHVDALGDAALLFFAGTWLDEDSRFTLARDEPGPTPSPDPCPPRPEFLTWTKDPQPGVPVAFDAVGADDPAAALARFEWDLDGDGSFELDTGADRHATRTFPAAGVHRIGLRVTLLSHRPGNSSTVTCSYDVRVGLPALPVETWPDPYGSDPPPPALPDESPWPAGPDPEPLPDVPVVPVLQPALSLLQGLPGAIVRAPSRARPALSAVAQPAGLALGLEAARSARRSAIARSGLPVVVRAGRSGTVRLTLTGGGGAGTLATRTVKVKAGRPRTVRLKAARRRLRALRRVRVEARGAAGTSRATVRLR